MEFALTFAAPAPRRARREGCRLLLLVQAPGPAWRSKNPERHQLLDAVRKVEQIYSGVRIDPAWIDNEKLPEGSPVLVVVDLDLPAANPGRVAELVALGARALLIGQGRKGRPEGDSDYDRFKSELALLQSREMGPRGTVATLQGGLEQSYYVIPKTWPSGTSYNRRVAELADAISAFVRQALKA